MTYAGRRALAAALLGLIAALATLCAPEVSLAQVQGLSAQPKYAAIVVDANSGEVLYAKRADAQRFPASITKVMTLYLTFEGLATGRLSMDERLTISRHAFAMIPSKVSTHAGETLTVNQAIQAVTVHSANDVAVALAERLGGTEERFAQLMTLRAQELGMTNSRFVNASGLPDVRQVTTARDIALLSRAVMRDYPQYYAYFGEKSFKYNGKLLLNHNHLVARMPGVDGLKTGFTNAAGFNLAASAVRDGRRLITVVLGGPSTAARDENVEELLTAGFDVLDHRARGQKLTLASVIASPDDMSGPIVRAPVEEGSGEQPDLKVVVQPEVRTMPMLAAARTLAPNLSTRVPTLIAHADASDACNAKRRGPRRSRRAVALCTPMAKTDISSGANAGTAKQASTTSCPPNKKRRRHASCGDAAIQLASASAEPTVESTDRSGDFGAGSYLIQVGAYKKQAQAQDHLDQVSGMFGHVFGIASAKVERAGGNYRVRFHHLSEKRAKAVCRVMAYKGQVCMVMGDS